MRKYLRNLLFINNIMSSNRSVQAAQRRRAGPANGEPAIPGRVPQPSINSAQLFANQSRPGTGPNIPSGRLAGQQVASNQKQMQQQMASQQSNQKNDRLTSVNKLTVPQAITLITLRLGAVESKLMNMPEGNSIINLDGETDLDSDFLNSLVSRIESIEQRSFSAGSVSSPEINLLKQQFETLKQSVLQSKATSTTLVKENSVLKNELELLKKEILLSKDLISTLQELSNVNNQKILELTMNNETLINNNITSLVELNEIQNLELANYEEISDLNEIVGTNLKEIIEEELNQ